MDERAQREGADGAELWRTSVRRLVWAAAAANGLGALFLFLLLAFLVPFAPQWPDREVGLNAAVAVAYLPLTLAIGSWWGLRMSAPLARWLAAGRPPTHDERKLALALPSRFALIAFVFWTLGGVLFTLLNVPGSGWGALVVGGAIWLGGETTCAMCYLLAERITRPVTVRALAGGAPPKSCGPGVGGRLIMAWSLGTGVPLLGVLVIAVAGLALEGEDPALLAAAVAFLAVVGMSVGLFAITVASRTIAEPIAAVRGAMGRVAEGELDVSVPVDDGSEVGLLEAGFNRMATGLRERERLHDLFGRHVGREVARAALEHDGEVELGGEVREVAVVFVDVVGSTRLAARRPPAEVVALLNDFFGLVVAVVEEHGGWVNKFEGDAALCIFGAPDDRADAAGDALRAARGLQERIAAELSGADAGIGVSAGAAVAGNVGAQARFEYTVIGDPVNEAARLSELAKWRSGHLLASRAVLSRAGVAEAERWQIREEVVLRGRDEPTGIATPQGRTGAAGSVPRRGRQDRRQGQGLSALRVRGR